MPSPAKKPDVATTETPTADTKPAATEKPATAVEAVLSVIAVADENAMAADAAAAEAQKTADAEPEGDNATGDKKPETKETSDTTGKGKETKPDEATKPAAKDKDELEVPKDITNPKTQERFRALANQVRDKDKELERTSGELKVVRRDVEEFRAILNDAQATPEEFMQLMDYSKAVKTGDFQRAMEILDTQRAQIARAAGMKVDGVDLLSEHPDLRKAVDDLEMDESHALEMVRLRALAKAQQEQQTHQRATADQNEQNQQAVQKAAGEIKLLAEKWQESDIDYAAKHQRMMTKASQIAKTYPPNLWKQALSDYYETLTATVETAAPTTSTPSPLRPGGTPLTRKAPKSTLDAVNAALNRGA